MSSELLCMGLVFMCFIWEQECSMWRIWESVTNDKAVKYPVELMRGRSKRSDSWRPIKLDIIVMIASSLVI